MPLHTFSAHTFRGGTFIPIRFGGSAGGFPGPTSLNRPASLVVTFPRWLEYRQLRGEVSSLGYVEEGDSVSAGIGNFKQVFSSAYWPVLEADDEADTDYRAPLQSLTDQIGEDYYSWLSDQYTLVFQGVQDWIPTGFDDCVIWEIGTPDESRNGEDWTCQTRVQSLPENFGVEHQLSQHADTFTIGPFQCGQVLGPVDTDEEVTIKPASYVKILVAPGSTGFTTGYTEWTDNPEGITGSEITVRASDFVARVNPTEGDYVEIAWQEESGKWIFIEAGTGGIPFKYTDSPHSCPAYGVMEVWGEETIDGVVYLKTRRPTATFRRRYLVNTQAEIATDETGLGKWLETSDRALIDSSVSTGGITLDAEFGVKKDYFGLFPNRPGFQVFRYEVIDTANVAYAVQREVTELIGKLGSGSISKGSTGAIDIYMGASGSEAATDFTDITCRALFAAVANSKWCVMSWRNGVWYVAQVECG